MTTFSGNKAVGVLFSGGLDSGILVGQLLRQACRVVPLFIRSGLVWQERELEAARRFLQAVASPQLSEPIVLELPLGDLYAGHWSMTGTEIPDARSPDEAVHLPGRGALLVVKAAVWCQLHEIGRLALGVLGTSPFDDARNPFFENLEAALNCPPARPIRLERPFAEMDKREVMLLGRGLPLEHTFSCLAPVGRLHCGVCNKCAERKNAFQMADSRDPTHYATGRVTSC